MFGVLDDITDNLITAHSNRVITPEKHSSVLLAHQRLLGGGNHSRQMRMNLAHYCSGIYIQFLSLQNNSKSSEFIT
jgi:hypothetical protein